MYFLKLRVRYLAFRALFTITSVVIIDALSAKVALTALGRAWHTFSDKVLALITFELIKDIVETFDICNAVLGKVEGFPIFSVAQVHLIASMFLDQKLFRAFQTAKLTFESLFFAVIKMMAEHVFLDDAIFLTLETTSTFLLMLFKLIIKELCLTPHGLEATVKLDSLQKSK